MNCFFIDKCKNKFFYCFFYHIFGLCVWNNYIVAGNGVCGKLWIVIIFDNNSIVFSIMIIIDNSINHITQQHQCFASNLVQCSIIISFTIILMEWINFWMDQKLRIISLNLSKREIKWIKCCNCGQECNIYTN
jgi:hypothetical protein